MGADIVVAIDDDVFDGGLVFGIECESDCRGVRRGIENDGGIDLGVGVALVEKTRLQKESR